MTASTTIWRVSPVAWLPISLAIAAETVSNALRAYGLGSHLDRFTVSYQGTTVSLAGAVLVLAAVAVSLTQARAAWVALTPGRPVRQRLVAGFAALLLLAISVTAMACHILDAQRAKVGDERGEAGAYKRAEEAHKRASDELERLGKPRPVSVIQAEVSAAKIEARFWRRSKECSDITKDDTKEACKPILELYKERGAAARKAELEPEVARLREKLAGMTPPTEEQSKVESEVAGWWAWMMGLGVVFVATFGSVIFATATTVPAPAPTRQPLPEIDDEDALPPSISGNQKAFTRDEALVDLATLIKAGQQPPSQKWLKERWNLGSRGTVTKWMQHWEAEDLLPSPRLSDGRCKTLEAA